ncbi:MAG: DHH family phosphoesterase [Selenomonadaceae bacterium]|nr:DHH family phosphoesterase [Selenomonadaceae bacterium]
MPRNMSAWMDLTLQLFIMLVMIFLLACYNRILAGTVFLVWICLALFARERCRDRSRRFERYCRNVVQHISASAMYAIESLPQSIIIVSQDERLQWCNDRLGKCLGQKPEQGIDVHDFWPGLIVAPIWGTEGEYVFSHEGHYYKVRHVPVSLPPHAEPLMVLYVQDETIYAQLKNEYQQSRTVLCYIQIDNYDEVMQGQTEAEQASMLLAVNQQVGNWLKHLGGFMRHVSDDLYVAVLDRHGLDQAMQEKFDVLDKVRQIQSTNRLPVTLSMGVSVSDTQSLTELGQQAKAGLDLALGRGGDQVAVNIGGKTQFFGGRAKAVEKHTRVKARVVAHAVREIMEGADEVYVMGHHNEDFDSLGAAVGIARMARQLEKPVHIVLSDMNEGIDKFLELMQGREGYQDIFVHEDDLMNLTALHPVLFVVDTHIPHLVAAPTLLERIQQVIVIDHHRRSESFIKNPLLVYIEPASSSTSELVTELLMYFSDDLQLTRIDSTALYSGIVVDTKNFAVQAGVRTFDAAAYLRRSGADPVMVRHLFRTDYETTVALARAEAASEYYPGGLIVSEIRGVRPNVQVIAAQAADALLRIENVQMSIVVFQLNENTVGISARSTGEMNVQVIMEALGGGGHQNVAGAQVRDADLDEIKAKVIALSQQYIEENEQNESDTAAGR